MKIIYDTDLRRQRNALGLFAGLNASLLVAHLVERHWLVAAACGVWGGTMVVGLRLVRALQEQRTVFRILRKEGHEVY